MNQMKIKSQKQIIQEEDVEDQNYYPQKYFNYGPLLTVSPRENKPVIQDCVNEAPNTPKSKIRLAIVLLMVGIFASKMNKRKNRLNSITIRHLNFISDKVSDSDKIIGTRLQMSLASFYFPNECINFILKSSTAIKATFHRLGSMIENVLSNIQLVHPNSNGKFVWDISVFIVRIILLIIVPLDIGFQTGILFNSEYGITVVINVIIQLDFLVRSCTLHFINGKLITNRLTILIYEMKESLVGDLLTCAILIGFQIKQPDQYTNFILLCIMYQYKYVYQFQQRSEQTSYLTKKQKGLANLFKLLFRLLFALHVYSCLFYFVSSQQLEGSWIQNRNLLDKSTNLQYLESFYFTIVTMLTIGYGDNLPYNSAEKIITCLFIIFSSLWYSYSINFIGSIINDITQNQGERDKKIRIINKYFEKHAVPETLQYQIKEYLNYKWIEDEEVDINMEQQLINQLSEDLKEELNTQIYIKFTQEAEFFFNSFSKKIIQQLQNKIKRRLLQPFDLFTIEFDGTNNLCFIEYGDVTQKDQFGKLQTQFLLSQKKGKFIQIQDFITDNKDLVTFQATSYVSLLTLSKNDFLQAIKDSPIDYQYYCEIRDSILFDQDHQKLLNEVYCNACQKSNHKQSECQFTHYIPNREVIIKRHCMPQIQQNSKWARSKYKRSTFIPIEQRTKLIDLNESQQLLQMNSSQDSINEFYQNVRQLELAALRIQQNNPNFIDLQEILLGETSPGNDDSSSDQDDDEVKSFDEQLNIKSSQHQNPMNQQRHETILKRRKPIILDNNNDYDMQSLQPPQLFNRQGQFKHIHFHKIQRNDSKQPIPYTESVQKIPSNKMLPDKYNFLLAIEHDNLKQKIQEFDRQFQHRLCVIYKNLRKQHQIHSTKQYYQDTEFLYLRLNQQYFEDLDQFQNFQIYKVNNNMPLYINDQKGRRFHWQQKIINRFIQYMYNPYEYINRYLYSNFIKYQKQTFKLKQAVQNIRNIIFMKTIAKKKRKMQKKLTKRYNLRTIILQK